MLQVSADLVFPIRLRPALEQRKTGEALHGLEAGLGMFPPLAGSHDFRLPAHPADIGINLERLLPRRTADETVKLAPLLVRAEQVADLLAGLTAFAEKRDPARLEVDAIGKAEVTRAALGHPARLGINSVLDQLQKARSVGIELAVRDRHVRHLVERDVVVVLEENRENPRAGFVGRKQANDIFAT